MPTSRFSIQLYFFGIVGLVGILIPQGIVIAFGVMGLIATGIAWFWNRVALEELSYEREFSQPRTFAGEELGMSTILTNKKIVPLPWVRIRDTVPDHLDLIEGDGDVDKRIIQTQTIRQVTSIAWYERVSWDYRIQCVSRGLFTLGPAQLESGDPFGFLGNKERLFDSEDVLVYPRVVPLEELGVPPGRPLGEVRTGLRIYQDPSRPSGIRDYQLGDPLKTVDWKATARMQKLQVRTYEPSSHTTVILVMAVDTTSPHWATYAPSTLERIIVAAASMASYAAEQEYMLGLFTNDMPVVGHNPLAVPTGRGPDQLGAVLGALAIVRSFAIAPMYSVLPEHARRFPMGSTLVVATAFVPPEFVGTLTDLKKRGFKIVVMYVGEEECPDLGEGIIVHELYQYLIDLEESSEAVADVEEPTEAVAG